MLPFGGYYKNTVTFLASAPFLKRKKKLKQLVVILFYYSKSLELSTLNRLLSTGARSGYARVPDSANPFMEERSLQGRAFSSLRQSSQADVSAVHPPPYTKILLHTQHPPTKSHRHMVRVKKVMSALCY